MQNQDSAPNHTPIPVSRRQVLLGAGAALVLAGCGGDDNSASTTTTEATTTGPSGPGSSTSGAGGASSSTTAGSATTPPAACVLSPELTAGPYHLDGHLNRADIREDRDGTLLEFRVKVLALPDCAPLAGAAVDIWQCDAGGEYSGFNGNSLEETGAQGTNDKRYLRGVQLTDDEGVATFTTIFPGWYEGRTVHIHLKVLEGGTLGDTWTGGHVAHVGQAFFDEDQTAEMLTADAYLIHTGDRTRNEEDSIFNQAGPGAMTTLTPLDPSDPTKGYRGEFTCMVDPEATPPEAPLF